MDFAGRTVVVTGGASGIGLAAVELLRQLHADVALIDWNRAAALRAAEATGAVAFIANMSDEQDVHSAFQAIERDFGRIDGLVSNAGVSEGEGPLHEESEALWDRVIQINLRGAFLGVRETHRRFLGQQRPGAIVCTSSVVGQAAILGGGAAYSASKAAIDALVRQVAVNYARSGIRINSVAPGPIETPLMWQSTDPSDVASMRTTVAGEVPLGRLGEPIEVARAIAWLLSDDAAYVTGATFLIDGGVAAKLSISA